MGKHYILIDNIVMETSLKHWAEWFETHDRTVAKDTVGDIRISTVFLGLDHGYNGELHVFETMVFGPSNDEEDCYRYSTWKEAYIGHKIVLTNILGGRRYGVRPVRIQN